MAGAVPRPGSGKVHVCAQAWEGEPGGNGQDLEEPVILQWALPVEVARLAASHPFRLRLVVVAGQVRAELTVFPRDVAPYRPA
jgi:hypothetical protein